MKKIYNLLIIAALLAVSCEKSVVESPTVETEPEQEIVYPEIQVALSVDTKTTISENGDSFSIAFAVDDDIAVFNGEKDAEDHLPCRYRCTRIEGGVAYFSYNPTSDAEKAIVPDTELAEIVAIYPFRGTTTSEFEGYGAGTVKFRFVNSHESSSKSFAKTSLPLVASAAAGSPLTFHHTLGMLQLNLQGSDCAVKQIVVESDQKIAGNGSVSYASATPTLDIREDAYSTTTSFYRATYSFGGDEGIALTSEGTPFYIGLPEGTHNLNLIITDADGKSMTISAPSVPISRGVVIPTTLPYTADPLANVTNLSAFGHFANCYVVSKAGNYCFNARKPDGTLVSGTKAAWVWAAGDACKDQASLPTTMMTSVSYENGKIYFSIPSNITYSKGGNVVLGVIDSSNNILYSWNVWLTTSDISDQTVSGITVMDRNLGAAQKFDVASYAATNLLHAKGSYYQWGRKDPFLGQRNSSNDSAGNAFKTNPGQYYVLNTELVNVDSWKANQSIDATSSVYPVYMASSAPSGASKWSDIANANPCPYGYRVLNNSEFASLVSAGLSQAVLDGNAGYAQVILGSVINLPRVGRRKGGDGLITNCATNARYYSDDYETGSNAYCYLFNSSDWTTTDVGATNPTLNANNACSVRCVKVDDI